MNCNFLDEIQYIVEENEDDVNGYAYMERTRSTNYRDSAISSSEPHAHPTSHSLPMKRRQFFSLSYLSRLCRIFFLFLPSFFEFSTDFSKIFLIWKLIFCPLGICATRHSIMTRLVSPPLLLPLKSSFFFLFFIIQFW